MFHGKGDTPHRKCMLQSGLHTVPNLFNYYTVPLTALIDGFVRLLLHTTQVVRALFDQKIHRPGLVLYGRCLPSAEGIGIGVFSAIFPLVEPVSFLALFSQLMYT